MQPSSFVPARLEAIQARLQCAVERQGAPQPLLDLEAELSANEQSTPMGWLRSRLGLTATEELVLWSLIGHELSAPSRAALRALNTESLSDPTTATLREAVYGPDQHTAWRELGPRGALRRWQLIERTDTDPKAPEHRHTWRVAARVIGLMHGESEIDPELVGVVDAPTPATGISGLGIEACASDVTAIDAAVDATLARKSGLVIVHGRVGSGRRSLLLAAAKTRGLEVLVVDALALPTEPDRALHLLRVIARECRLLGMIPLVRNLEALADVADRMSLVEREFADFIVLATATRGLARRWRVAPRTIELANLTGTQRARLWGHALAANDRDAEHLATMYPIAPALIDAAARIALEQAGSDRLTPAHIMTGLRSVLDDKLAGLATRVEVSQDWTDLVLPPEQTDAVVELLARIRERRLVYEDWGFAAKVGRGLGVSALFSGPPGTGKTMAAGLVARDLGTALYQVDLSKIVSKWIGETEKNLATLFDAAEAGHAILLFDEADTLFGKRTDVKSSNDRNANQETNYLLQRLESFGGVCILTTNHDAAIDEAFRRRLSIHVQFPMPEVAERTRLWRALLPATAPVEGLLELEHLARNYEMSGGYIRNAVLRAAFLAADERSPIAASHLSRAAQLEYQAMGRVSASLL